MSDTRDHIDAPDDDTLAAEYVLGVLDNLPGPARDVVIINAGAALYAANVADSVAAGVDKARAAIESGAAKAKLAQLAEATTRAVAPAA